MLSDLFQYSSWLSLPTKQQLSETSWALTINNSNSNTSSSDSEMDMSSEMQIENKTNHIPNIENEDLSNNNFEQDMESLYPSSALIFSPVNNDQPQNYLNPELQAFEARLNQAKYFGNSSDLVPFITPADLIQIYDYVLSNINGLNNLAENQAVYLDKHHTGLPRTINILRSRNNEYKLILETKSKLADGTKEKVETESGAMKKGKPAWRVDTLAPEPYFNLVVALENEDILGEIQKEVACSKYFASDYVNEYDLGQVHEKNGKYKVSVYAPKAVCDLNKIIDKGIPFDEKLLIISDILQGIKQFHDAGFVHQDLKPKNILIYSKNGKCRAKITDFGLVDAENTGTALASNGYHSPEMAYIYADPSFSADGYNYFNGQNFGPCLADLINKALKDPYQGNDRNVFKTASKSNDMWALGIIIYELLYDGKHPNSEYACKIIQHNSLLCGLLKPNRQERINIDKAIEIFNELYQHKLNYKNGMQVEKQRALHS